MGRWRSVLKNQEAGDYPLLLPLPNRVGHFLYGLP